MDTKSKSKPFWSVTLLLSGRTDTHTRARTPDFFDYVKQAYPDV